MYNKQIRFRLKRLNPCNQSRIRIKGDLCTLWD